MCHYHFDNLGIDVLPCLIIINVVTLTCMKKQTVLKWLICKNQCLIKMCLGFQHTMLFRRFLLLLLLAACCVNLAPQLKADECKFLAAI